MKRPFVVAGMLTVVFLRGGPAQAEPAVFRVVDPGGRNQATFESQAPLETIRGKTGQVDGKITLDPAEPMKVRGSMTVRLAGLDTGDPLRNAHMREHYLETGRFPAVTFEITEILTVGAPLLEDGVATEVTGKGVFKLHGVSRKEPFRARVTWTLENEETRKLVKGNLLRVRGEAVLNLADYRISIPPLFALKLDETITVVLDVWATDEEAR